MYCLQIIFCFLQPFLHCCILMRVTIKRTMKQLLISILFIVMFGACQEKEDPFSMPDMNELWTCNEAENWDEQTLQEALIGEWKWMKSVNPWFPDAPNPADSMTVVIAFHADGNMQFIEEGNTEFTTGWDLVVEDWSLLGVQLDTIATDLLYGRILLCNDILLFNNSYIDGADNYFKKID